MSNKNLSKAKNTKMDEFYTQLVDIEKELVHYNFTDKIIYCNCDGPESNFVKYFRTQPIKKLLVSNGLDFRSEKSIELLEQADIVVTNPPFSLFREYVAQLIEYDKKFLIIGNLNAITYKEIFPLIKDNKLWLGAYPSTKAMWFEAPYIKAYECVSKNNLKQEGSKSYIKLNNVVWYTNLNHGLFPPELELTEKFDGYR